MTSGWRGRAGGLAIVGLLVAAVGLVAGGTVTDAAASRAPAWRLAVTDAGDRVVARVDLPDGRFALRYRNSVYGSPAEERFAVGPDGRLELVGLAADEAAVLGEYYTAESVRAADAGDARRWVAAPAARVAVEALPLAATEHGRRTLVVPGQPPILLWLLTDGDPELTLAAERAR